MKLNLSRQQTKSDLHLDLKFEPVARVGIIGEKEIREEVDQIKEEENSNQSRNRSRSENQIQ